MQLGFCHVVAIEGGCDHGAWDGIVGANHAFARDASGDIDGTSERQRIHEIGDTA